MYETVITTKEKNYSNLSIEVYFVNGIIMYTATRRMYGILNTSKGTHP